MDYSSLSNIKVSFAKYKGKTYQELSTVIITNDKKYLNTISKILNTSRTSQEKKEEVQNFLNYFYNFFEPNFINNHQTLPSPTEVISSLQNAISTSSPALWLPDLFHIQSNLSLISHIFHISDIHIRLYNRQKEYQEVFNKLYELIEQNIKQNPNQIIIITGDLLHSKNNLSPECILNTQNFLIKLSSITLTLLIAGNHDALLTNNQREDSITAIVENLHIPNFYYLKNSGVYYIANLSISVNSLLDNKWIYANSFTNPPGISHKIALYHGGVGIIETGVGHRLRGERLVEDFDGYDYVLLGDIHKFQFLDPEQKKIAYASSLIAQNFNEWNSPHGALHWDLFHQNHIYYPIENKHGFFVFNLINNNIFVEEEIISSDQIYSYLQNMCSSINVKLNIKNCTPEFISKINYLVKACSNDVKITHNFLGNKDNKSTQEEDNNFDLESIQNLLTNHLKKSFPNLQPNELSFIMQKYQELHSDAEIITEKSISKWELIDLEFSNLFGYGPNNYIDFSRFTSNNPIGIIAPNSHGKSSLIDIILFTLFTKFSRSRGTGISKDIININCNNFTSKLRFKIGSNIYVIIKEGKREHTEKIKITKNEFYCISDEIAESLNDEDRRKTDKVITELIGSYDDFIFTNVQLQNRTNSFKEMTDKDRKEYLYKVLKLNIWNDIVKKLSDHIKPIKNQVNYLDKYLENKSIEEIENNILEINLNINNLQEEITQQLYEKDINMERQEEERQQIKPNPAEKYDEKDIQNKIVKNNKIISEISSSIDNYEQKLKEFNNKSFKYIKKSEEITNNYLKDNEKVKEELSKLKKELESFTQNAIIPTVSLWKKLQNFSTNNPEEILSEIKLQKSRSQNIITEKSSQLTSIEFINILNKLTQKLTSLKQEYQNKSNEIIIIQSKINPISKSEDDLSKKELNFSEIKSQLIRKKKEKEVVELKINNFNEEISKFDRNSYDKWMEEQPKRIELKYKIQQEIELLDLLKELENHKYDPKCKFCIKNPIIKQKESKKEELKKLQQNIKLLQQNINISDENGNILEEQHKLISQVNNKLNEKKEKLIMLDNTISKMELEFEKTKNQQEKINQILEKIRLNKEYEEKLLNLQRECKELEFKIEKSNNKLEEKEKEKQLLEETIRKETVTIDKQNSFYEIIQEIIEINIKNTVIEEENNKIQEIKSLITNKELSFKLSQVSKDYENLQNEIKEEMQLNLEKAKIENKLQEKIYQKNDKEKELENLRNIQNELENSKEIAKINANVKLKIDQLQSKIINNDKNIGKLKEKLGINQQKLETLNNDYLKYQESIEELKSRKSELKLLQILEQSLGKDGLPLIILQNYLIPITQSINNIISPFISRIINLRIENDDLILDSFPTNNSERSVYMHGGMESFILDIAFKITLSNFAKLPKCDILFLDEGISAFDNERLNNIDILFDFIKKYFSKTILITHIDSVKESIMEKIEIIKENSFSKIQCEYISNI